MHLWEPGMLSQSQNDVKWMSLEPSAEKPLFLSFLWTGFLLQLQQDKQNNVHFSIWKEKCIRIYSMSHQIVEKNGSYCVLAGKKISCYLSIYFSVFPWAYFFLPSSCIQLNPWNHQKRGLWCLEGFCYLQILVCKTEKKNIGFSKIQVVLLQS